MMKIQVDLRYHYMLVVSSAGRSGGLAKFCKEQVNLHIQTYSQNHIDVLIVVNLNSPWRIIGFYGRLKEH